MAKENDDVQLLREVTKLGTKMDMMHSDVTDLKKNLSANYMPRAEIESRLTAQGERMGRLEARVRDLEVAKENNANSINETKLAAVNGINETKQEASSKWEGFWSKFSWIVVAALIGLVFRYFPK